MAQASTKIISIQSRPASRPSAEAPDVLTADVDPTRDIRNLIEQLQDSSKDARSRQAMAEDERDQLSQQLERIQAELEASAQMAKNIDAIIAERDELIAQGASYGEKITAMQHKLDVAEKDRGDISKQRDELTRKTNALEKQSALIARQSEILVKEAVEAKARAAEFNKRQAELEQEIVEARKQSQEAAKSNADAQKQVLALRQARDAAAKQVLEMKANVSLMEDQLAEVNYQLEKATANGAAVSIEVKAELAAAISKYEAQASELENARKDAAEVAELRTENEELAAEREREIGEFTNRIDSLRSAHESELAVARQQHETSLKERDLARERAQSMHREVELVRQETLTLKSALAAAEAVAVEREKREGTLNETLRALEKSDETLRSRAMEADRRADLVVREKADIARALEEAQSALREAQKQTEFVIRDRDALREKAVADAVAGERDLKGAEDEIVRLKSEIEALHPRLVEHAKLVNRFEQQRLDTIELSAQLENAQREIKEMGANLAESRLMVKNAERRAGMAGRPAVNPLAVLTPDSPSAPKVELLPVANIDNSVRREFVASMRGTFQTFTRRPGDISLLNELFTQAQNFAESSKTDGELVLQRVSILFASLLSELHLMPEQVTPAMLRTINQTIEFLASLLKQQSLDRAVRLDDARVYAVDDDAAICDSVTAVIREVGLGIKTTRVSSEAILDLAGSRYDLIILDVHLPEIDGFELCTHIRDMALHTETPIVFLSGNASMENRVQSSLRGGNEFISKPFNFQELGLKVLTLILRGQLKMT